MRATFGLVLSTVAIPAMAVDIDGRIGEEEWRGAQRVSGFRLTVPLSREPLSLPTEAMVLAAERGLAVAFRSMQPASVPRHRQRGQRDNAGSDRVNLYVDFDGDGRAGYNFTVTLSGSINDTIVTNENQFNPDWDGNWPHAVSEDDGAWYAELLVPWHTAPMRDAQGEQRAMRIGLERFVAPTGQRASWPAVGFTEPRFLTRLQPITVPAFELRNLGFQVRYRYERAPLSYLYLAYVRGGSLYREALGNPFGVDDAFRHAFDLRDSEQRLLQLSYRFEI